MKPITVVGCGPGGADLVTPEARAAVADASILLGTPRLLELFPETRAEKLPIAGRPEEVIEALAGLDHDRSCVVLVSGDTGACSLARAIVAHFGIDSCRLVPGIGSLQVAFARLGLEWFGARLISAHAAPPVVAPQALLGEERIAIFTGNPAAREWLVKLLATLLPTHCAWWCERLTLPDEHVIEITPGRPEEGWNAAHAAVLVLVRRAACEKGMVHFVGAGPGDPELLTLRAARLLGSARCCIYAGSLVNPRILDLLPRDAERHDSAGMTLDETMAVIRRAAGAGIDVVRLHTGEPALYGAIGEQMVRLDHEGIPYDLTPGISAFQAAAAALRRELTAPEVAQTVVVTRAAGRTPVPESERLARIAPLRATLCVYLSAGLIEEVVADLLPEYGPGTPSAVVYHASWPDQVVVTGPLSEIAAKVRAAGIEKTAVILVGEALAGAAHRSRLYDPDFAHGARAARKA
jgi:precorrin-4/cobalt-precorrin-4 C11-methyltransferase